MSIAGAKDHNWLVPGPPIPRAPSAIPTGSCRTRTRKSEEAAELEIAQKIGNLFGVQGGSRQIVLCKKLACMVELLLERRAFV